MALALALALTSSCNESLLTPLDHRSHIADTRTFHRCQHRHGTPLTSSTDHFSGCGASTVNLRRRSQLSPTSLPPPLALALALALALTLALALEI